MNHSLLRTLVFVGLSTAHLARAQEPTAPQPTAQQPASVDPTPTGTPDPPDPALEVQVHGQALSGPSKEPSVAGSVIRRDRLRAPGAKASDVLRTQPGIAVLETGGFGCLSTASMRGATAAQTPVYLGGIRLNDDVGGSADLSVVPLWLLHRIEIYRSHAPIEGDQLGIGGAIFFEPRRPHTGFEAGSGVMAGSYGAHALWAHAGMGTAEQSFMAGVRLEGARNDYSFVNDGGTRFDSSDDRSVTLTNSDARIVDGWALASVQLGERGRADLLVNTADKQQGLPVHMLFPSQHARQTTSRRMAAIATQVPCADKGCELSSKTSAIFTHTSFDDPLHEIGLGASDVEIGATRVEESVLLRQALSSTISIAPNLGASLERLSISTGSAAPLQGERASSRLALQGSWQVHERVVLRALAGGQCDATALVGTAPWTLAGSARAPTDANRLCGHLHPAVRAGVEWTGSDVSVLANAGRYVRVPTLGELYGISGAVRGNTALVAESGSAAELGLRWMGRRSTVLTGLSIDAFVFVRWAADLIAYERATTGYAIPYNVGSARVAGLEALTRYRPLSMLQLELAVTLRDPHDTARAGLRNDLLPYVPRLVLAPRVELSGRPGRFLPVDTAKLTIVYFHQSSYYDDRAGLLPVPAQGWLDLDAELGLLASHLALRVRVANLLAQTRFDLIGYPLPGRAAYIAMEAKW